MNRKVRHSSTERDRDAKNLRGRTLKQIRRYLGRQNCEETQRAIVLGRRKKEI